MKINLLTISLIFLIWFCSEKIAHAQISGTVYSGSLYNRLPFVTVMVDGLPKGTETDSSGNYSLTGLDDGEYKLIFRSVGYLPQTKIVNINKGKSANTSVSLTQNILNLNEVTVSTNTDKNDNFDVISKMDLQLRPVNSSQDLLRLVPGLFIAQHAGGGKAEQIFFRGFDIDHGTDFAISVDGLPVNMVSHAHGQGYADLHFLIPETVKEINVSKGPYKAKNGDFATSGSAEFSTLNFLDKSQLKLEYGQFNTLRGMAMIKLLDKKNLFSKYKENAYLAAEYNFSDLYFNNPSNFKRFNILGKYHGLLTEKTTMTFSLSSFASSWNASGQIPERSLDDNFQNWFGSIDPTEGGNTSRTNANISFYHQVNPNQSIKNQFYFSRYDFNLFSNFTFFLKDSVHGDGINQTDHRNIFGYIGSYSYLGKLAGKTLTSTFGAGARYDNSDVGLIHEQKRTLLDSFSFGKLNQLNAYAYIYENLQFSSVFRVNSSARMDFFIFDFKNKIDNSLSGNAIKARVSPKLNLFYNINPSIELFAKAGFGFHSNDARVVVANKLNNTLPLAFGTDLGSTFKIGKNALVHFSLWMLNLQSELVYVGDEAMVEPSGRTQRKGIDFNFRYEPLHNLFLDFDANYNHGRLADEAEGKNHIPLAPVFTSIAGISYKASSGLSGSLRYRYISNRPANEDYSLTAKSYFLLDAALTFSRSNYQFGLSAENLLNTMWKEAQFATESRLQNETEPVTEIHFTPGRPRYIKGSIGYIF